MGRADLEAVKRAPLLLGLLAACSTPAGPGDTSTPTLEVTLSLAADTIDATLAAPLRIRVTDDRGQARSGIAVRLQQGQGARVLVTGRHGNEEFDADTTNTDGTVQWTVQLGDLAGTAVVTITIPVFGLRKTVDIPILPGALAGVTFSPADTSLLVGGTAALHATAVDRLGNPRVDPVAITLGAGLGSAGGAGVIRATTIGRSTLAGRAGAVTGTGYISVVPDAVLASALAPAGVPFIPEIDLIHPDGSQRSVLAVLAQNGDATWLNWSRDGTRLAYQTANGDGRIHVLDLNGARSRLVQESAPVQGEAWPQYSQDGQWVYYEGLVGTQSAELWRIRPDGFGAQQIGPDAGFFAIDAFPAPSPDGTRVAFVTNRRPAPVIMGNGVLAVLDLGSGLVTPLDLPAATPRWSPLGDFIAYVSSPTLNGLDTDHAGEIHLVSPGGTGDRVVAPGHFFPGFDWSPDGQYLVARSDQGYLAIIQVGTGVVLPLAWSARYVGAAWKP